MPNPDTVAPINYLAKGSTGKIRLVEADQDTFLDVLDVIDDYEGMFGIGSFIMANFY